jgi:hypothetical protein
MISFLCSFQRSVFFCFDVTCHITTHFILIKYIIQFEIVILFFFFFA